MDAERIEQIRNHATAMTPWPIEFYYNWYTADVPELLDEVERLTNRLATQKKFLEHHINNERMLNSQIMRMRENAAWTIPSVQMPDDGEEVMVIAKDTRTFQYRCFSPVKTYTWNEARYWQSNAILLKEVVCWKYAPTITAIENVDE